MRIPNFMRDHSRGMYSILFALLAAASVAGAFLLRFEYGIPAAETEHLWKGVCFAVAARVIVFRIAGCDRGGWRFSGLPDAYKLLLANVIGSVVWSLAAAILLGPSFPRSVYGIELVLSFLATAGARVIVRSMFEAAGGVRTS